jgi:hypothetical protein
MNVFKPTVIDPFKLRTKVTLERELSPFEEALFKYEIAKSHHEKLKDEAKTYKEEHVEPAFKLMASLCQHEKAEKRRTYTPGSYYDQARTVEWMECPTCGTKSGYIEETHSWYG